MKESLKVVAWDDPRCVTPLEAAGKIWKEKQNQDIGIIRRPLTDFNDQPLAQLSPLCDVMIIDYPHIAQALHEGAITSIDELLDSKAIENIAFNAVGPAQDSFIVDGRHTALASDTACHVSAFRQCVLDKYKTDIPKSWEEVIALSENYPGSVAVALYQTDAISCLMSLTAGYGIGLDGGEKLFTDQDKAVNSIERIIELASIVDPRCWESTPQAVYRWATKENKVAYLPLTFGYSHLGKTENGAWRFGPPPTGCGSLLGGAGMAVSSQTKIQQDAVAFTHWYCDVEGQLLAGRNWGQPAGKSAWEDSIANEMTAGFYAATRATQENAYVRPRATWWPELQKQAGIALVKMLQTKEKASDIVSQLEKIYAKHRTA